MNILDKTAALFGGKKQTSADLQAAHREVQQRLQEIDKEVTSIRNRELDAARQTGTHAQVQDLEQKLSDLQSEELTLLARRSRLHNEARAAKADEAIRDAAKTKKALNEPVSHAEQLREQLAQAEATVQRQMTGIREMRQITGNNAALDLDESLAERMAFVIVGHGTTWEPAGKRQHLVTEFAPRRQTQRQQPQATGGQVKEGAA